MEKNLGVEEKYPVAIFELIKPSKNGANFVREDTIGTSNPVVLDQPKNRVIMNTSVVRQKSPTDKDVFINVDTRYIYNQEEIFRAKQEAAGMRSNEKTDKIRFINGLLTVPKDGAFVGLYNFMTKHAQNESNEDAPKNKDGEFIFQPIFREVKPVKQANDANLNDFLVAEAVGYIRALVRKKGEMFGYDEERINALCAQFNVTAETIEQSTTALIAFAKVNPKRFLDDAKKTEQVINIEVQHALKLGLISIEGDAAVYVEEKEKIKSFTAGMKDSKKVNALVNYFSTVDGKEPYQLFKARLVAKKDVETSKN